MDFGKLIGTMVGGLGAAGLINRWITIDDDNELVSVMRLDIRGLPDESVQFLLRSLDRSIELCTSVNDNRLLKKNILVREILSQLAGS
ncbi:MAG: hypothetical protein AB7Q00_15680 [Phycisphaerales bacterium]